MRNDLRPAQVDGDRRRERRDRGVRVDVAVQKRLDEPGPERPQALDGPIARRARIVAEPVQERVRDARRLLGLQDLHRELAHLRVAVGQKRKDVFVETFLSRVARHRAPEQRRERPDRSVLDALGVRVAASQQRGNVRLVRSPREHSDRPVTDVFVVMIERLPRDFGTLRFEVVASTIEKALRRTCGEEDASAGMTVWIASSDGFFFSQSRAARLTPGSGWASSAGTCVAKSEPADRLEATP